MFYKYIACVGFPAKIKGFQTERGEKEKERERGAAELSSLGRHNVVEEEKCFSDAAAAE